MGIFDLILMGIIFGWLAVALTFMSKRKKSGGCTGCIGNCGTCSGGCDRKR